MTTAASNYVLQDLLGVGGMGEVYAALDANARPVAIKVIAPQHAASPAMPARLTAEAVAGQRVQHPNVVRVLDHGASEGGTPYLVMERVSGRSLGAIVRDHGPLAFSRIRRIGGQILAGIQAIHDAGLVHADIKADNIIVDADRQDHVTIIDFGLACAIGSRSDERVVSGTPEYMAPEQIRGEAHTTQSDLYAVGVILYELVTGTTPHGGGSPSAVFQRHLHEDLVSPTLRSPDRTIPPALERIIVRALAKDPARRQHSAALFATALDRALRSTVDGPRSTLAGFSTSAPTCEWARNPPTRSRTAAGTTPRDSDHVTLARGELATALAAGTPDPIIAGYLALVESLLGDHRLGCAARELDGAIASFLDSTHPPAAMWRLSLALGALREGLGERSIAKELGRMALALATRVKCVDGIARADAFLRRLGG